MPVLNKKIHAFCSWASVAVLYLWPVLTLIAIIGVISNPEWVGRDIVLVATLGTFILFIAGCCALVCATLRRPEDTEELRPLVVLYQVMFVPTLVAYTALILVVLCWCFGVDILPDKGSSFIEGWIKNVCCNTKWLA